MFKISSCLVFSALALSGCGLQATVYSGARLYRFDGRPLHDQEKIAARAECAAKGNVAALTSNNPHGAAGSLGFVLASAATAGASETIRKDGIRFNYAEACLAEKGIGVDHDASRMEDVRDQIPATPML